MSDSVSPGADTLFPGTEPEPGDGARSEGAETRYEIIRTIGQGNSGSVLLAHDRDTGEYVALKRLLRMDPKSVMSLKHEFRALADIHHPNLAKLYDLDLGVDGDAWFITMEYIDGPDLMRYLGVEASAYDISATREVGAPPAANRSQEGHAKAIDAFYQLACGVRALHEAGMLHRDLKPSNVLVANGRVVVLDFGLVRELAGDAQLATQDGLISGTPAYMAPEQARGQPLGEVADWYAFGVMLYQALSGELPIDGRTAMEILLRKSTVDPLPLERVAPDVSRALGSLCDRLLSREPTARPNGAEVLRVLEAEGALSFQRGTRRDSFGLTSRSESRSHGLPASLFGRRFELLQLEAAVDQARDGNAVTVHVRGTSGAGKSALVEHFAAGLEAADGATRGELVLRSRCCEREAMPFKALDGVMDALVRHIAGLDDFEAGNLLPADVAELAQLFPTLQRLPGVQRLLDKEKPRGDALQVRMRAENALRELFARVAARRTVVLWIDDLQWGDLDSANILKSWSQQLAQVSIALVFSYRSDEIETSPCLRILLQRDLVPREGPRARERVLDVVPLHPLDLRRLCEHRLGAVAQERPDLVDEISRESHGNPFLVSQLAALVRAKLARGERNLPALSIEQLVSQTSALLQPEARQILAVLAIASRPLPARLAMRAAGVSEARAHLHALRGLRLVRTRDLGGDSRDQRVEVYHDRVRQGVLASLGDTDRAHLNESLLDVLEAEHDGDVDWLHTLALAAGRRDVALQYGLVAAERASSALAFERAAELFRTCLQLTATDAPDRGGLWLQLARALARCRRGVDAAEAYVEASNCASPGEVVPILRLAASHFLRSGEFGRGDAIGGQVLAALGLSLPESDSAVIASIVWERAALAVRGLHYVRRAEHEVPAELLRKIDLFTSLSIEKQAHDPLRAALIQSRCLRWALAAGEPRRVARALCVSATMTCVSGSARAARQSDGMLERASAIAAELGQATLRADGLSARAVCSFLLGRPAGVLEPSYEAERIYRADTRGDVEGDYYHTFTIVGARVGALNVLGETQRAFAELQSILQEARATSNRSIILQLTLSQSWADELLNQPGNSKARLLEERELLPPNRFGSLHLLHMLAVMRTACATHDYGWAEPMIQEDWPRWKSSPVRASAFLACLAFCAHARYELNRHVIERKSGDPMALVRADLRALGRLPFEEWRTAGRCRVQARVAYLSGQRTAAVQYLRQCVDALSAIGGLDEQARDRYALGFMLGGDEGARMRGEAHAILRSRATVDPLVDLQRFYPELV